MKLFGEETKPCKACGNPVSTNAEGCPNCGRQTPNSLGALLGVAMLVGLFWIILA